jgi:DUF1365 family protein
VVTASGIYEGTLMHARRTPAEHSFRYAVSYTLLDLDEVPRLEREIPFLSVNRFNLVSLDDRDHFAEPGRTTKESVLAFCGLADARVLMLSQLRLLGQVFNPVSFYWVYGRDGSLACMVSEINNTFGERLPHLLSAANSLPGRREGELSYAHDKRLHVSPFFGLDQSYRYFFSEPGERVYARIDVHENGLTPFHATLSLRREADLTAGALARALLRHPLMPAKIVAGIHWEALRLWGKRVPFHHKPPFVRGKGTVRAA